jgi:hypothetical protein
MNNFLFNKNWFEKKYRVKSDSRYLTFKTALNLFLQQKGRTIVETGTTRLPDDWGAGMSTLLFADYLRTENPQGSLITIDIDTNNLNKCKEITAGFYKVIKYVLSDSVEALKKYDGKPIDLLFLDSFDYPYGEMLNDYGGQADLNEAIKKLNEIPEEEIEKKYKDLIEPAQQHQLNEYLAVKDKLSDRAIVLLDDNDFPGGGKCRLTKEQLLKDGWILLIDQQQSLWMK